MIKTLQNTLKQDKEGFVLPRSVQDAIPIRRLWPDGIFQFGSKFSKTIRFSDINYAIASKEDKTSMFLGYSELLNALDTGSTTKITINNKRLNRQNFEQEILIPRQDDYLDGYRAEYNSMLMDKVTDPESEYGPLIEGLGGEVISISASSRNHINAMDMEQGYGDGENPVVLKSEFLLSLCEQLVGSGKLSAKEKSIIDRCTAGVYHEYIRSGYRGAAPTLQDFHAELLRQTEPEARDVALAIELFTEGSLNTFAKPSNVDTNSRILCYDIRDLGKQLLPVGMLVVLDSVFNRVIRNRQLGRNTWVYVDEIYLLFQHEYSANFLFTLWKRVRKYGACCTGITQNLDDLLQSHTARTMLANSEFLVMLNQAATDRAELAQLLNISDNQLSYITNVDSGRGLIKCGSTIVPFMNSFPKNTRLYKLMSTKFMEQLDAS